MQSRHRLLLTLCLALFASACGAGRDFRVDIDKIDASGSKVDVKVGGVDLTVKIGETEKERADVGRQLEELKTQLAAKDALHANERAELQERQIALQEKLLSLTEQLVAARQGDANLRSELARMRAELKTNSEELARLRRELAARPAEQKPAPAEAPSASAEVRKTEAYRSPVSFALLINDTGGSLSFSVVNDDETLKSFSIGAGEELILKRFGDGIEIQVGACRYELESVTLSGGRSAEPDAGELPGNCLDFDGRGSLAVFPDDK